MDKNFAQTRPEILQYVEKTFVGEDPVLHKVIENTQKAEMPEIQVSAYDGLHLEVLTRACGAQKAIEIGTLAGYSAICIARGLTENGKLWTFEFDQKHAQVAEENFRLAGFDRQIELLQGAALEKLEEITSHGPFDLVFIDADKINYPHYLDWAHRHLRPGGLVIGDNTFAFGHIARQEIEDDPELKSSVEALRQFNAGMASSGKFRSTILPTGEGLTVGVKL